MAMPASSQGLKNRAINSSATAPAPIPVNAHQALLADEADTGDHEAGGGHQGDDPMLGAGRGQRARSAWRGTGRLPLRD